MDEEGNELAPPPLGSRGGTWVVMIMRLMMMMMMMIMLARAAPGWAGLLLAVPPPWLGSGAGRTGSSRTDR